MGVSTKQFSVGRDERTGAGALELAITLPLLILVLIIAVDFARLWYHYTTITNCARNGAMWASDEFSSYRRTYADHKQAAIADGKDLSPPLTADNVHALVNGTDAEGHEYVEVTVEYSFDMLTSYLGVGPFNLQSTVRMRKAIQFPDI